ncbi:MAG: PEP-CTERM sorting domain-containing protein [Steroidobacteraceae bacterium]
MEIAVNGMQPIGGWELQDSTGDSLYGSLNGLLALSGNGATGLVDFDVTGGAGLFDNISSGSGRALAGFNRDGFGDLGKLSLETSSAPSTVPEPGALLLFAAALAALGCWSAGKRRRAFTPASL